VPRAAPDPLGAMPDPLGAVPDPLGAMPDPLAVLLDWFACNARDLPWRRPGTTAWGVLVSEVMLAQTPVARVLPAYDGWLRRWPDPAALAAAPAGEAVRQWGRLGYPRRALRLHAAAVACVERHAGEVPRTPGELRALPGIGSYTAAAVAAFAYGVRVPVIDTNVRRVVARWSLGVPAALSIPDAVVAQLLPAEPAAAVTTSAALMELGALVCVSRGPRCTACPLAGGCRWIAAGAPTAQQAGVRTRRAQAYVGTDRQVRGRLLAVLRAAEEAVSAQELEAAWPEPVQRGRALASLLADGLAAATEQGYALPG
jgi:A/G-specific adenine glycosylase